MGPKKVKTIEDTYQKKTQLEHVLHRPGMYIGDIDHVTAERWIFDGNVFVRKNVSYSPGLYKIFDEIFTNATDHSQRDPSMKKIEVMFLDGEITIMNDGEGIPIEIHKELGKYVPEIIFGEFKRKICSIPIPWTFRRIKKLFPIPLFFIAITKPS
jgi:DNA topoisomerase-2